MLAFCGSSLPETRGAEERPEKPSSLDARRCELSLATIEVPSKHADADFNLYTNTRPNDGKHTIHSSCSSSLVPIMSDAFDDAEDAPPSSPPMFLPSRKRARDEETNTSSDPPLFSSDPPDPSIDNYTQRSRKRQYQGTWWGQQVKRRPFARNFDSGIWMGSDSSDVGEPYTASNETILNSYRPTTRAPPTTIRSAAETEAYRIVNESVERDAESVDISLVSSLC
jgi:hypothetical protein